MPKPRPLTALEAKRTLANRLGTRLADNLRQLNTKFGARPYRVFMVWTKWTGSERGEGDENVVLEREILPTPKVESTDTVSMTLFASGVLEMGSVRVSEVSLTLTRDVLTGRDIPGFGIVDHIPQPYEFFYEVREDGRGELGTGALPQRLKFRMATEPFRAATKPYWTFMLEKVDENRSRLGKSNIGDDATQIGPGVEPPKLGPGTCRR